MSPRRSVMRGAEIDVHKATRTANDIMAKVAEEGLSKWLETVREHHQGTYQHCLLFKRLQVGHQVRDLVRAEMKGRHPRMAR